MMRKLAVAALLILACGVQKATAQACWSTVKSLDFGTYTGSLLPGVTSGTVTCGGNWNMPLDAGTGAGATETTRRMTGPAGATLDYRLFTDAAHTNNWGNTTGNELTGTGNENVTIYGQLAAGLAPAAGTYTDTIHSATTIFTVTVVAQPACSISASDLSFGIYSGAQIDVISFVTVKCTNLVPFDIGLNQGMATGATVKTRKMTGPAPAMMSYSLYRNTNRTQNWGNTVGTDTLHKTGSGSATQYTVYGRVLAGQSVIPGSYTDTIVATVTY